MGSLHRISDSLDYKFDRMYRISEFSIPFFVSLSQLHVFLYVHMDVYLHVHIFDTYMHLSTRDMPTVPTSTCRGLLYLQSFALLETVPSSTYLELSQKPMAEVWWLRQVEYAVTRVNSRPGACSGDVIKC